MGDGINDAPALPEPTWALAWGGVGSDVAIEAADVVIMDDNPARIADAIETARRTRRIVMENIVFAIIVKLAVLAMGTMGVATMWNAVFADVGVALIAVVNATRAYGNLGMARDLRAAGPEAPMRRGWQTGHGETHMPALWFHLVHIGDGEALPSSVVPTSSAREHIS